MNEDYKNYNAEEARKKALAVKEERQAGQLEFILELINDHSNEGEFFLRLSDKVLTQDVKEELQNRGFNVYEVVPSGLKSLHFHEPSKDTIIKW